MQEKTLIPSARVPMIPLVFKFKLGKLLTPEIFQDYLLLELEVDYKATTKSQKLLTKKQITKPQANSHCYLQLSFLTPDWLFHQHSKLSVVFISFHTYNIIKNIIYNFFNDNIFIEL